MPGGRSCHDGTVRSFGEAGATSEGSRGSCSGSLEFCQEKLQSEVDQASEAAQQKANELQQRSEGAQTKASDSWAEVQSDWTRHIATARKHGGDEGEGRCQTAQLDADIAVADAEAAIDFAFGAVEEAEYAVLNATLAQMEADAKAAN